MDSLIFTNTNKGFTYENDLYIVTGFAHFEGDELRNFDGDISTKEDQEIHIGNIHVRRDGENEAVEIYNATLDTIDAAVDILKALSAKMNETLQIEE